MTTPQEYEAEIESIMAMNLKLKVELTKALDEIANMHARSIVNRPQSTFKTFPVTSRNVTVTPCL